MFADSLIVNHAVLGSSYSSIANGDSSVCEARNAVWLLSACSGAYVVHVVSVVNFHCVFDCL